MLAVVLIDSRKNMVCKPKPRNRSGFAAISRIVCAFGTAQGCGAVFPRVFYNERIFSSHRG